MFDPLWDHLGMGQARWHREWGTQRPRHVWVRPSGQPGEQPRQGLLLRWERNRHRDGWLALVVTVERGELRIEVLPTHRIAPVESDPNRALSRDTAIIRGLRRSRSE